MRQVVLILHMPPDLRKFSLQDPVRFGKFYVKALSNWVSSINYSDRVSPFIFFYRILVFLTYFLDF
jgi:hypothetical protein